MAAIEVENLTVRYRDVVAVRDLSFTADAGQVTCVIGRNGAGKTSTIEALEGIRRPSSGRLEVTGLDPHRDRRLLAPRVGVMLQDVGIQPAIRVGESLRHAAALYPTALDPHDLIERVGLQGRERRTFRQLSGGEQRRLALALALVGRPQVAFLDEPTTGVDPEGRQVIRQIVRDLRDDGVTVLLSTHELDEAERLADRVLIVDAGRLLAEGTVAELTEPTRAQEVRFRAPADLDVAALSTALAGPTVTAAAPGEYVVAAAPTPTLIAAITNWLAERDLPLEDLRTGRRRLEDAFLDATRTPPAGAGPEDTP